MDGDSSTMLTVPKGLAENFAPLIVENVKKSGFTHILAGHSAFGKNLMPRIAALLDTQQISDIMSVESEDSKAPCHRKISRSNISQHLHDLSTPGMPL